MKDSLREILESFPRRQILVVGDIIADQFIYGEIARISREAPVMILRHEETRTAPGGASNAANNLAAMTAKTSLIGAIGQDSVGAALREDLQQRGVDTSGIIEIKHYRTPTKARILAGSLHSTRQQVIRLDYEKPLQLSEAEARQLITNLREQAQFADAIIVSDYNYGLVAGQILATLRELAQTKPVIVDSRHRLREFNGFTGATPNESEAEELLGTRFDTAAETIAAGQRLVEDLALSALLITRGPNGMTLFERDKEPLSIPIIGGRDVVDVTGAGDTVIAIYTLA